MKLIQATDVPESFALEVLGDARRGSLGQRVGRVPRRRRRGQEDDRGAARLGGGFLATRRPDSYAALTAPIRDEHRREVG